MSMNDPTCEKCGAPITTGMMALLCPGREECAMFPEDADPEFVAMFPDTWTTAEKIRFQEHCDARATAGKEPSNG
jgi:hypothetical protein